MTSSSPLLYLFFLNFRSTKSRLRRQQETERTPTLSNGHPGLFLVYFRLFKQKLQFLQKYPSSIRCWDSNSRPLDKGSQDTTSLCAKIILMADPWTRMSSTNFSSSLTMLDWNKALLLVRRSTHVTWTIQSALFLSGHQRIYVMPEHTHLRCKMKYHYMAVLLFDWFGFGQTSKSIVD